VDVSPYAHSICLLVGVLSLDPSIFRYLLGLIAVIAERLDGAVKDFRKVHEQ